MKIALFVHCFFPRHFYGTETYTLNLALRLKELGHEPIVVTAIFPGEAQQAELITHYEFKGIPVVCFDKNYMPNRRVRDTFYQPETRDVFDKLLDEIRPDLVHVTHLINHTAILLEVLCEKGIPTVGTLTDFYGVCFNNKLENAAGNLCAGPNPSRSNCLACYGKAVSMQPGSSPRYRVFSNEKYAERAASIIMRARGLDRVMRSSIGAVIEDLRMRPDTLREMYAQYAALITPTAFLQHAYKENGFTNPMHAIWFGTDIDRTLSTERSRGSVVRFGFIGQIAPHKGTDLLIRAFSRLPKGSATLDIYGPAEQDPRYFATLKEMATEGVNFRGTFPSADMARVLSQVDVLVIPSVWYENSPLVLLDALATKTPVIVSDVEGLTEFISEDETGMSFERGSVHALAVAMQRLVHDRGFLDAMIAKTAYPRTVLDMVEDTVRVYHSVA
ncbi:glycosyltransferase family 4 protein [Caballeronia zhejiangensis]|uniref:Glycosyl transferase n=1 Tax=Caballeronia zhejiangensis TaxID=871203 RepID=A0A656QNQ7_9BURK|nr:glycosyltransferase family 4 protein [Caballeronia zhejiangensis]KDR31424.1 glycosyl transferase [Caballeronia zhejiangensis]